MYKKSISEVETNQTASVKSLSKKLSPTQKSKALGFIHIMEDRNGVDSAQFMSVGS